MAPAILLVDDQRDILRLLHSALDTLRDPNLEIFEAGSGEAALKHMEDQQVDLLVTDYNLPGITGAELMRQAREGQPELAAIVITGNTDRKVREEILNAGAVAVFSKPVPLGDFLGAVERGLGVPDAPVPINAEPTTAATPVSLPDVLGELRAATRADAAILISRRGKIVALAGKLRDSSMEVSLTTSLASHFLAALKVAESNRQQSPDHISIFSGGDQDLIFMPVDPSYAVVLAGAELAATEGLAEMLRAMRARQLEITWGLQELAKVTAASRSAPASAATSKKTPIVGDMEKLLQSADGANLGDEDIDAYWEAAAAQHGNKPVSKDVITYEDARKLGLTPDADKG